MKSWFVFKTVILLLLPLFLYGQSYDKPGNYGLQYKRLKADSSFKVPVLTDTLRLSNQAGNGDIIYVQSPTGIPDTGYWVYEKGRYKKVTTNAQLEYFKQNGVSWGVAATIGTNDANPLDFETNNTVRGRIGATGNWMIGTTTDAGYRLDINGTSRHVGNSVFNDSLTFNKLSTDYISSVTLSNSRVMKFSSLGSSGGFQGGFAWFTGTNGLGTQTQRMHLHRAGALGLGETPDALLSTLGKAALAIRNTQTPTEGFTGDVVNISYTNSGNYTRANNRWFVPIVFGQSIGGDANSIATSDTANSSSGFLAIRRSLGVNYASDLGLGAKTDTGAPVVVLTVSGYDSSVGIRTTRPMEALHIRGKVKIDTIPTVTTYDSVLVVNDGVLNKILFKLSASATLDFPSTASNDNSDLTISVPGAVLGDVVAIGHGLTAQGTFEADVSAADTVTVRFHNTAAGVYDPPSDTFKVYVFK